MEYKETLGPCEAYDLNDHLINKIKHRTSGRANSRSSESDPMSV